MQKTADRSIVRIVRNKTGAISCKDKSRAHEYCISYRMIRARYKRPDASRNAMLHWDESYKPLPFHLSKMALFRMIEVDR